MLANKSCADGFDNATCFKGTQVKPERYATKISHFVAL